MAYQEQYERVQRWYGRLKSREEGLLDGKESYQGDYVFAFLESCSHLRDWIRTDDALGAVAKEVDSYVARNEALDLCHGLANQSKHFRKDTRSKAPAQGNVRSEVHKTERRDHDLGDYAFYSDPYAKVEMTVERFFVDTDDGRTITALELATECMAAWAAFFEMYPPPKVV